MRTLAQGFACLLFSFSVASPVTAEMPYPIAVIEDASRQEAVAVLDGCRVSLERRTSESHLLHFRHDCRQSLEEKLALLKTMLETLMPEPEDRRAVRSLFIGRLAVTFPECAQRLALAASGSPDWDPQRPWKESGYSNRFVFTLLQQIQVFQELKSTFAELGFDLQVASVEKILMATPNNIPFGTRLLEQGADPHTKLPFDALTWFYVEPLAALNSSSQSTSP